MKNLPRPVEELALTLQRLPGVGPRTAERLAIFLTGLSGLQVRRSLKQTLEGVEKVKNCKICFNLSDADEVCAVCKEEHRDKALLCVVEKVPDLVSIERAGHYRGVYHILGGVIDPLAHIGPENLNIASLLNRVKEGGFKEVVLAVSSSLEGEATVLYLVREINKVGSDTLRISRIGRGIPTGGDLEFADTSTLQKAMENREKLN